MAKALKPSIIEASHRLRMVQKDFADQEEPQRREFLCEELERLLKEVPFGERNAFLQGLLAQFPVRQFDARPAAGTACSSEGLSPLASSDPLHLVEALLRRLPSLAPDQREAVLGRLREVVAGPSQTADTSVKSVGDIQSTLHMPENAQMDQERLRNLTNLLAEFVVKLEQLTVTVWSKICGRSTLRPPKHIEKTAGRFLSEDHRDAEELVKELRLLLQFATAVMTAASRAGDEVAKRHSHRFSPEAIRILVEMEPARLRDALVGKEVRYWRKYCELAEELGAEYIEKEIESAMSDYAEAFVRGLERLS